MVENRRLLGFGLHLLLIAGAAVTLFPLAYAMIAASHPLSEVIYLPMDLWPGDRLWENLGQAWERMHLGRLMVNSLVVALGNATGTVLIAMMAAFGIVFFNLRCGPLAFWAIFCSMMVPIEVRIVPTYEVAADLLTPLKALAGLFGWGWEGRVSLLDSYLGLTLPILASASCTFFFRQFLMTLPDELAEAAMVDGAGPWRYFLDHVLPLSRSVMAAMFLTQFVSGWNQYLWPILVTTRRELEVVAVGLARMMPTADEGIPEWNVAMAGTLIILVPPLLVILLCQRAFVRGLVAPEK